MSSQKKMCLKKYSSQKKLCLRFTLKGLTIGKNINSFLIRNLFET